MAFSRQRLHLETIKVNALPIFVGEADVTVDGPPVGKLFVARRTAKFLFSADVHLTHVSSDVNGRNSLSAYHADVSSVTHSGMDLHQFVHRKVLKT